jgi:3,4-dihydroxy 2-butanone 4-phosphate synthase / GTP cyclohydrolase II
MAMDLCTPQTAIEAIRNGRMVIVVDDADRENEGDLVMAAECVTPEAINFMETHARGWICVPMVPERLEALDLPLMVARGTERQGTAFTVTVDARRGTTTGISCEDQTATIRALADEGTQPSDLLRPGHVRPLRAQPGGVLARAGHTEAAVDLARLAGRAPAGIICEIKNADGSMARFPDLRLFAARHGLPILRIADLIQHRRQTEKLVRRVVTTQLPTAWGTFTAHGYVGSVDTKPYVALVLGEIRPEDEVLVRVHSGCLTGDVFHSMRCDCGEQLQLALEIIEAAGKGVLLYLEQEGRGIGLINKLKAYALQDVGLDTVQANERLGFAADLREYGIGAQVLHDLGVRKVRLMTNNPRKRAGLEGHGLEVVDRVPLCVGACEANQRYLNTKRDRLGHLLPGRPLEGSLLTSAVSDLPPIFLDEVGPVEPLFAAG